MKMNQIALLGGILALAIIIPPIFPRHQQDILFQIVHFGALATWWNILGGFTGQFSLGNGIFLAAGAYTSTLLFVYRGISPWLGLFAGVVVAVLIALLIGYALFRSQLRGAYFALATLVASMITAIILDNWILKTTDRGIGIPLYGNAPMLFQFNSKLPYYYIGLVMLIIALAVTWYISHSKTGLYWQAIRENEAAAAALGINVFRYKLIALLISAAGTAASGTLQAQHLLYIDTRSLIGFEVAIRMIVYTVVGGIGTVFGPAIGALFLVPVVEWLQRIVGEMRGLHMVIYGIALVLVPFYLPEGLVKKIPNRWSKYRAKAGGSIKS